MNQGKLDVVKQKMARVNIDILGISELKWTGMGEFNSDDHYIYYCGQEYLRRNGAGLVVNKSPKCSTWVQSHKRQNDLCSFPSQTIQYHSNPCLCLTYYCQRCWNWPVLWRPKRSPWTKTEKKKKRKGKDDLFIIKNWNAKGGRQEISRIIGKFGLVVQMKQGQD